MLFVFSFKSAGKDTTKYIDLSRQKNTTISQQINFTKKLKKDDGATMFFYH